MLKHLIYILAFFSLGIPSKEICTDPDYIFWPERIDSTKIHLENIVIYYIKVDSITTKLKKLKEQFSCNKWRLFYKAHLYYEQLEMLSKLQHPKREEYYRKMKVIYYELSNHIRQFNLEKKIVSEKYNLLE